MSKITLVLSSTQISDALKCPHMWALGFRENLAKADQLTKALDEGSLIHAMLEVYYTLRAASPATSLFEHGKAVVEVFGANKVYEAFGVDAKRWEFLCSRFIQYQCRYSQSDLMPIVKNGIPAVEVGFSKVLFEDSKYLFVVESRLDLIVKIGGELFWVDHKTQQQVGNLYKFSPQFLTYAWATGFERGMINYIRTHQTYDEKHTLHKDLITFPKWLVDEWEQTMLELFYKLAYVLDKFGTDAHSNNFKRERASCGGAFQKTPCQFTQICETQDFAMRESIKKFSYIQKPPRRSWDLR